MTRTPQLCSFRTGEPVHAAEARPTQPQAATPLVLLPGTLCDSRVFAPLLQRLAPRETIVGAMAGARSAAALAQDVLAKLPDRFALLGFSLGAVVALEMAVQASDRVAGLAILSGNAGQLPAETFDARRAAVAIAKSGGLRAYVAEFLWPLYTARRSQHDAALHSVVLDMAETVGVEVYADQVEVALTRLDSRPRLSSLDMPVLALCGAEDEVCTPQMHREIAQAAPDATLVVLQDCGHFSLLEAPDAVSLHVGNWLSRVDGRLRPEAW